MKFEEILGKLKEATNFKMVKTDTGYNGWGNISNFTECRDMTRGGYHMHYERKRRLLESLPWTMEVGNPRNPKEGEYPAEDGRYVTMLDCNEHEVLCNRFEDGRWTLFDRTHVKWWMPIPENFEIK